jgi:hypothetical protein
MASGIKGACNRPKTNKNLRGGNKQKRHKVNNEAQAAYHAKIAARRSKRMKK